MHRSIGNIVDELAGEQKYVWKIRTNVFVCLFLFLEKIKKKEKSVLPIRTKWFEGTNDLTYLNGDICVSIDDEM